MIPLDTDKGRFGVMDGPPAFEPVVPLPPVSTVLGVVVADQTRQAAIVAVRYQTKVLTPGDPMFGEQPTFETHYNVLGTQWLPADTTHAEIARRVNTLAKRLYDRDSRGDYHVLVDASDVGAPVVDGIRAAIISQVFVTSVTVKPTDRGDESILWRNTAQVGLRYLISRLQAILQAGRLHIPADDVDLIETVREYDINEDKADLTRALALACAAEFVPILYDRSPDDISGPVL